MSSFVWSMRRKPGRSAFTLVELLVVMSIIAMLAAMLMPAVNAARETARRTQCINHQRNLALAMQQANTATNHLPGWAEPMVPWEAAGTPTPMSWVFSTLPYMERGDIYRLGTNTSVSATWNVDPFNWPQTNGGNPHVKVLVCPNDSTAYNNGMNISYVVNAGYRDGAPTSTGSGSGGQATNAVPTNPDGPNSAVFHNNYPADNVWPGPTASLESIAGGDGTSNTLMFSENVNAGRWDLYGASGGGEGAVSFCFADVAGDGGNLRINGALAGVSNAEGNYPGANSYHPNGVVAAFCDGHTVFISQDVAWNTWALLFTPRGDSVSVPGGGTSVFAGMVLNERY